MEVDTATEIPIVTENPTDASTEEPGVSVADAILQQAVEDESAVSDTPIAMLGQTDGQEPMDILENQNQLTNNDALTDEIQHEEIAEQNEQAVIEPAKQSSDFNLGVPGLNFSPNNVKTANDGTKMVQIHQSQITPEQLVALQNNPNIKVVFRHVPSGKSYTKPPRHLLPPGYSEPIRKRKAVYTEKELGSDDVYSFDEGVDTAVPIKMMKTNDNRARYNYGGSAKGKKGRPRVVPDAATYSSMYLKPLKQSNLPAKVILTDLLGRINSPNAKKEVKLHTSQINAEVLANMDLNPYYKIVLTTKQELPPLVIEDVSTEEKERLEKEAERVRKEEEEKLKAEAESKKGQEAAKEKEEEEKVAETIDEKMEQEEEEKRIAEEKDKERKQKEAERLKKMKEEEEELLKSVMQTQTSRSGRVRKPSRFSLDIARLTKRKSVGVSGESSTDDSEQEPQKPATLKSAKKTPGRKSKVASEPETEPESTPKREKTPGKKSKDTPETQPEPSPKRETRRSRKSVDPRNDSNDNKDSDKDDESAKKGKKADTPKKGKKSDVQKGETDTEKDDKETEKDTDDTKESGTDPEEKANETTDNKEQEAIESEKEEKTTDKKEQEATESEKEITSTENVEPIKIETDDVPDNTERKKDDDVVSAEPDTSTDATETPAIEQKTEDPKAMEVDESSELKIEEEEEEEVIDNRYRLRKLLEQCSAEEIRSVMLPEAFESINMGDFLLYKSGQMNNDSGKISFPQLYKQFETLHKAATKEATRYNTLVGRANKIGGDKRMEKIVLMPVYNMNAANSLEISNSSIDAHICGIQKTVTTQMIAANSFFIKSKMETPKIRLRLPEATAPKPVKQKQRRPLFTNHHQQRFVTNQRQIEPDSTTPDKPNRASNHIQKARYNHSNTNGIQARKLAYLDQSKTTGQISSTGQNHMDSTTSSTLTGNTFQIPVESTSILKADAQTLQMSSASSVLEQFQATVNAHQQSIVSTTENSSHAVPESISLNPSTGEILSSANDTASTNTVSETTTAQTEQYFVAEDGVPVSEASITEGAAGEAGKQLVPLGDGQYVELPEGYSLIQTDEGYIIGQPGSTFTQGEDGNVYVTNSDGTTSEITQEQDVAAGGEGVNVVDQLAEG
ncbi:uncharacterized protein LOC120325728 isoform X2 [Styela clava]